METASLSNSRYFILYIDDYTRSCWVYFLKAQSEVAEIFWKFKVAIENQACCKLRILKSDNRTKYTYEKFQKFCEYVEIEHQLTNTYTPQQNGITNKSCERVNYAETFAPVARLETIKLLLTMTTQKWWKLHQLDVKFAFLNGILKEEVYVEQPQGFVADGEEHKGYKRQLIEFKKQMWAKFEMSDLGGMTYFLASRPYIMFAVSLLSRFMHCCNVVHFKAAKRVLRYIKGTLSYGIEYVKENGLNLIDFIDSDWAGSVEDMKSTLGYFFTLGLSVFNWSSKKQEIVAQSTVEAEYIATAVAHFKMKYHFVREVEQLNEVKLVHCSSDVRFADILTKPLGRMRFERLRDDIGVRSIMTNEECCEVAIHKQELAKWRTRVKPARIGNSLL
ncbi:Integrase, catalytic core [Gossypium australe]|uniref:Integrase, catalytic core n=1 Tax=Gossypium australe TaxID=47621 RepID=A0A5B6WPR6_9ROSI|nr:Integrase, catalytic core [Gossypium australe]